MLRCEVKVPICSFAVDIQLSQHQLLKRQFILSLLNHLGTLVSDHLPVHLRVYFSTLNSVPLVCMSVFRPVPSCLDYCSFLSIEVRKCGSSTWSSFSRFFFSGSLELSYDCHVQPVSFCKKASSVLIRVCWICRSAWSVCHINSVKKNIPWTWDILLLGL